MIAPKPPTNAGFKPTRLQHVMRQVGRPVKVVPDATYAEIGVRSHGRGVFCKEPITGDMLGDKRVFWVEPGALVFNIVFAWERAVAVLSESEQGLIGSHRFPMYRMVASRADPGFMKYFFTTGYGHFLLELNSPGAAGRNKTLNQSALLKEQVYLPPVLAQKAIADYLDEKTAAIDALIEKKRKLLDLLAEERAALINQVVTKGLDPTVQMKDSGIPWIGEIPMHWAVSRLSFRYEQQLGKMLSPTASAGAEQGPYLGNKDVQWRRVVIDDLSTMSFSPMERAKFSLKSGDLLVCEGGEVGRTAIWRDELQPCYFQKAIHRLRPIDKNRDHADFLYYCMRAATSAGAFEESGNRSTISHLTGEGLRAHRFPWPPKSEQVRIAHHLDKVSEQADSMVRVATAQIDRLQEYRQALITAAVTGQLDIEAAA